ncbi:unnamed protein product [Triticum turgidum subsp. durum]|uniref:Glycosyltransferase 61 catalytic domain-containing protein n=2 Tax=Triticum TaxID=4564 RepID=A0A9R0QX11_TRITD|nr:unnamed protein product [Triticum turgidum subsp. durum]
MMKAGERPNSKLLRGGGRQESRRFRMLAIVVGFFIVSLTFVLVSKPDAILFGLNGKLPADQAPASILIQQKVNTPAQKTSTDAIIGGDPKVVDDETYVKPKGLSLSNVQQEQQQQQGSKPLCDFSNFRANVCEMRGDVRVHPKATSVLFMEPEGSQRDEVWKIKPYPRKGDEFCLSHITELTVKSSKVAAECTRYHDVPVVIFSLTGYTGNLFHDFTDVIVPLFTTASQFDGEVQFLITDMALWWTIKYHTLLQKLSKYPLIDFSKDDQVHCFKHAIVGTHAYMEFTIDATKSPNGVTMVDFNRFMRSAYSLPKAAAAALGESPRVKPRLLIIKRHRTRMFLNLEEIIGMAEELGFEVVIDEANVSSDINGFAKLVNSVDVMMGVHGAGLTNCVFLPQNATLIQIVPFGGLDWISRTDFGNPSEMMGLRYKQYAITVDESSLTDHYPRDHKIFKDPISFHKRGFEFIRRTFMDKQNVRLDCKRFRPVLLEALDNLNQ